MQPCFSLFYRTNRVSNWGGVGHTYSYVKVQLYFPSNRKKKVHFPLNRKWKMKEDDFKMFKAKYLNQYSRYQQQR